MISTAPWVCRSFRGKPSKIWFDNTGHVNLNHVQKRMTFSQNKKKSQNTCQCRSRNQVHVTHSFSLKLIDSNRCRHKPLQKFHIISPKIQISKARFRRRFQPDFEELYVPVHSNVEIKIHLCTSKILCFSREISFSRWFWLHN